MKVCYYKINRHDELYALSREITLPSQMNILTNENALFQSRLFRITLAPLRWWLKGDTSPSPTGHPYPDFDPCTTSSCV